MQHFLQNLSGLAKKENREIQTSEIFCQPTIFQGKIMMFRFQVVLLGTRRKNDYSSIWNYAISYETLVYSVLSLKTDDTELYYLKSHGIFMSLPYISTSIFCAVQRAQFYFFQLCTLIFGKILRYFKKLSSSFQLISFVPEEMAIKNLKGCVIITHPHAKQG